MVEFQVLGSATEKVGFQEQVFQPEEPTPIEELLGRSKLQEGAYIVLIDGKAGDLSTPVSGDTKV
ncbi:MAG: hypothetical protein ACLFN4_01845, partial [Candidatus Acetothermia bacterium]